MSISPPSEDKRQSYLKSFITEEADRYHSLSEFSRRQICIYIFLLLPLENKRQSGKNKKSISVRRLLKSVKKRETYMATQSDAGQSCHEQRTS